MKQGGRSLSAVQLSPAAATTTISCKDAEERFGMGPNTFH